MTASSAHQVFLFANEFSFHATWGQKLPVSRPLTRQGAFASVAKSQSPREAEPLRAPNSPFANSRSGFEGWSA